jgi:hypothetical protein
MVVDRVTTCLTTPRITILAGLALADITAMTTPTQGMAEIMATVSLRMAEDAIGVPITIPMAGTVEHIPTTTAPDATVATTPDGLGMFATRLGKGGMQATVTDSIVRKGSIRTTMGRTTAKAVQEARSMVDRTALTVTGIAKAAQVERLHQAQRRVFLSRWLTRFCPITKTL